MNANFKTRVFGGFDREDVISFIEKTSLEHQKRVSALEEENKRLSDRCGAAEAEVQALREQSRAELAAAAELEELKRKFAALKAENEQLKQQISDNAQLVRDAQIALEENNQLRSQLGQPENTRTTTTVSAEVIARSPGDWADTLTLDKGSSSGVNKDDLVTTVDGMLGFVSEVTDNTCEVTSITDPKMQCGALVTRTRETAIAEGDYNLMTRGALRLSYLREDSKVVVGDTVETSGRGGVFPKGILIGTVESVQPEESGLSYYAVIKPFVSVDSVSSVSIITEYTDTAE